MANNQMALPDGESEIMTQAEAYRLMGVTRAQFRGFLDRGELDPLDHKGTKGAARVARVDVVRLMAQRGLTPVPTKRVAIDDGECADCPRWKAAEGRARAAETRVAELAADLARMKRAFDATFS
ncbi:hypothetical protein [Streptomyces lavendulocolor]|uniref:hypothetical protein n=1 Tax=Streptomyces lavendulocolor TaxID=67316 RepID=UPI0031E479E8